MINLKKVKEQGYTPSLASKNSWAGMSMNEVLTTEWLCKAKKQIGNLEKSDNNCTFAEKNWLINTLIIMEKPGKELEFKGGYLERIEVKSNSEKWYMI